MPRHRTRKAGFSLAELLIVIVIIGILSGVSLPRMATLRNTTNINGAMTRLTRAVMAARQSAIQRGKRAYFKTNNSYVWVTLDTTGNNTDSVIVTAATSLSSAFGVTVSSPTGLTTIEYDPRGIATQSAKKTFVFTHTSSGQKDSICVSKLGNTIRERCP
jgi:prepilin-type N-terminal cleavage/methylation domain-containing protein